MKRVLIFHLHSNSQKCPKSLFSYKTNTEKRQRMFPQKIPDLNKRKIQKEKRYRRQKEIEQRMIFLFLFLWMQLRDDCPHIRVLWTLLQLIEYSNEVQNSCTFPWRCPHAPHTHTRVLSHRNLSEEPEARAGSRATAGQVLSLPSVLRFQVSFTAWLFETLLFNPTTEITGLAFWYPRKWQSWNGGRFWWKDEVQSGGRHGLF